MEAVNSFASWWPVYYSDHQFASTVVRYAHLAALMLGGGAALVMDRLVLASARRASGEGRLGVLASLRGSHAVVVPALAVVATSGVLMAAADWSTFADSRVFWAKMAAVGLLMLNGAVLFGAERAHATTRSAGSWRRLVAASGASFLLWLLLLWMGEWLTVAA